MATSSVPQVVPGLGAAGLAAGTSYSALPRPDSTVEDNPACEAQRVVLAVFLGGCTFSEIAALRFLGKERGCKFIFLTTAITNSARMMEAMIEAKA